MSDLRPPVDLFLASYKRPERLAAMIESVRASGYPARVCVAAGDPGTIETCARYLGIVECVYSTEVNRRIGCTAPLNFVFCSLVRDHALFCTDDCIFGADTLDIAVTTLLERFPDSDGVVGLAQENIPGAYELAFPLLGRAFLDRFRRADPRGRLFMPGYYHLLNDAELGVTIACLGNWVFEPRAKISHFHPDGGGDTDATFRRGFTHADHDLGLWCDRRERGVLWGIDPVPDAAPNNA